MIVKFPATDLRGVQVSFVHIGFLEAIVALFDNRIKKVRESFVRLFVSCNGSNSEDERMAGVVNTSLNGLVQCKSTGGHFIAKFAVQARCQMLRHQVVVVAEIGVVRHCREAAVIEIFCSLIAGLNCFVRKGSYKSPTHADSRPKTTLRTLFGHV